MAGSITSVQVESYGEHDQADIALCKYVYEILQAAYPNHGWMVGANSEAGTCEIDLPYDKPYHLRLYGYRLYISTIEAPDNVQRIRHAGGELLERFGLARRGATDETRMRAAEQFDTSNHHDRSKH